MRVLSRSKRQAALVHAADAAERALCLAAMILRTEFEMVLSPDNPITPQQRELVVTRLSGPKALYIPWLRSEGLWPRLSHLEASQLLQEFGSWPRQTCVAHFGDGDAAGVLVWALSLLDRIPAYDTATDEGAVLAALPLLQPVRSFIDLVQLRPEQEILDAREQAQAWLWRARTAMLQRQDIALLPGGPPPNPRPVIAAYVRQFEAKGGFTAIGGDFPAFGKAYTALSDEDCSLMYLIALNRLRGLNWLCGYAMDWDAVPLES